MTDRPAMTPLVLEGRFVRLEPMCAAHAEGLALAAVPHEFRYFLGGFPSAPTAEAGIEYVALTLARPDAFAFTVVEKESGSIVGSTSYLDIKPPMRSVEIGSTWLHPSAQGREINPEMKFLMLRHAFEALGYVRVHLKTDSRNTRSQRAIEKLGAKREGVFRKFGILADGHIRDAVMYSILDEEWPEVKTRLSTRLALFD